MLTPRLSLAVLVSFAAALTVALSPPPPPTSASQSTAPRRVSNSTQSSSGRWPRDTPDLPPLDVRLWSLPVNALAPLIMDATIFGTKWATVLNNVSTTVVTSAFIADMAATLGVSPSCMNATTVLALTNGSLQLCFVVSSTLPHTVNETLYLASQATLVNLSSVYFTHRNSSCGDCRAYSKSNIPLLYVSAFTVLDSSAGAGGMMLRVPPPADHTPLSPAPPVTPAAPVIVIVRSSSSDACDHDCLVIIVVACPVAVVLGCIGAFACWIVKSKNPPPAQDASMPTQAQIATMPHTWDAETLHAIANHPLARGRRQVPINSGDTVFIDLSTAPNPLEVEAVVERNSSRKPKRRRRVVFVMEVPTEEETSHPQEDSAFDDPKVKLEVGGDEGTT